MRYLTLSIPGSGGTPIQLEPPSGVPSGGLFDKVNGKVVAGTGINAIGVFIDLILIIAIFLSVLWIIRGGINIMTSGGDKEKFQRGRERVRYAIIGLIVIFVSFFLVNIIGILFGVNLLRLYGTTSTQQGSTQQEQKPKSIDEQLMKICTDRWGQSYCTCLLNAKSALTIDQQAQVSNIIIGTNQIPQQVIDLAKSTCGDAK